MVDFLKQQRDRFFAELTRRELANCAAILAELSSFAADWPEAAAWCDYFAAILVQERTNDFGEAVRRYRALLAIDNLPPFLQGQVLVSLAGALLMIGAYAEALQAATTAVDQFQGLDEPLEAAKAWAQSALLHHMGYNAGDFSTPALTQGLTACQQALRLLAQATVSAETNNIAVFVWNTLGLLHSDLLDWPNAIVAYQQLFVICERTQNLFGANIAQSNLGLAYRKLGQTQWAQAESALLAAQQGFQNLDRPYEELTVLTQLALLYAEMERPEPMDAAFTQALHLLETVRSSNSSVEARAGFLATVSDLLANAVLSYVHIGDFARAFACMEQARARAFLDLLALGTLEFATRMATPTLTVDTVQRSLPADTLLLIYFTTGLIEAPDRFTPTTIQAERPGFPRAATLLFALTSTTFTVHEVALTPNDLYPADWATPIEAYFLEPTMRRILYDLLIAPVAEQMAGKTTILLAPHGPLHYVPFQALLTPTGETLLRQEGPSLVYIPSASILLRQSKGGNSQHAPAGTSGCLAIGCNHATVQPTQRAAITSSLAATFSELRYAEDEALTIARLTGGDALVGPQPKKAQLFAQTAHYRWLHFSCHGYFDPSAPLASALYIGEDETLTAQEVFQDLKISCELVTLSACASGLSRISRGDELYGLVRAFLYAGAGALVVTQWRVDERSTHLLMNKFYAQLMQGNEYATALQQAQLYLKTLTAQATSAVLADLLDTPAPKAPILQADLMTLQQRLRMQPPDSLPFADPYFWAPFILVRG